MDQQRGKYATAHDFRGSFGEQWASRVMPQALVELMRHESIDTTLKYYVGRNAQRTAKILKEACEKLKAPATDGEEVPRDTSRDTTPPAGGKSENRDRVSDY